MNKKISVSTPNSDGYEVVLGTNILDKIGDELKRVESLSHVKHAFIISDTNVAPLYLARVIASLQKAGFTTNDYTIAAGEASKNVSTLSEIWEIMARLNLTRDCVVLALGGGVVGDIAGFAAATYMRGVKYVQVPTTLLAMVDSSVGGKTAINLSAGKNLVGNFWQPALVYADVATLNTLNEREWLCGLGEVAKSALVDGEDFYDFLLDYARNVRCAIKGGAHLEDEGGIQLEDEGGIQLEDEGGIQLEDENGSQLENESADVILKVIERCVEFKARIVSEDELESKGIRECLNYGHTLAHAIETLSGYGTYSHGAAVACGMRFASALSCVLATKNCAEASKEKIEEAKNFEVKQNLLLNSLSLNKLPWRDDPRRVLAHMKRDKKTRNEQVRFVFLRDVGSFHVCEVEDEDILAALEAWL